MAVGEAVRYEILGTLRIRRGEREVPLDRVELRALLAVLLVEANDAVPLSRIAAAVWPGLPVTDPATEVGELFADLDLIIDPAEPNPAGGRLVALNNGSYMVCVEPADLDTGVFAELSERARRLRAGHRLDEAAAALRQALGMWRGEPLAGLPGAEFAAARARIGESRCAVFEELAEIELEQDAAELVRKVTRWVTEYPLSERLRAVKMIALDRAGRRDEALTTFYEFQRITMAVHGVEPSERLLGLRWRIDQGTLHPDRPIRPAQYTPPLRTNPPMQQTPMQQTPAHYWTPPQAGAAPYGPPQPGATPYVATPSGPTAYGLAPYSPTPQVPVQQGPAQYGPGAVSKQAVGKRASWQVGLLKLAGAVIPIGTIGLGSPLLFFFLAVKRRSWALFGSALGYAGAIYVAMELLSDSSAGLLLLAAIASASIQAAVVIGRPRR